MQLRYAFAIAVVLTGSFQTARARRVYSSARRAEKIAQRRAERRSPDGSSYFSDSWRKFWSDTRRYWRGDSADSNDDAATDIPVAGVPKPPPKRQSSHTAVRDYFESDLPPSPRPGVSRPNTEKYEEDATTDKEDDASEVSEEVHRQSDARIQAAIHPKMGSVLVHLFEWSWDDIAIECERWLGPKGFTAVQISPPQEHVEGEAWYTRYQPVTYNITSRGGDEQAFRSMVQRCAAVGVGIYADVVINHVARGRGTGVAGSSFTERATPLYEPKHFHHSVDSLMENCVVNSSDPINMQYCDLAELPDLRTSSRHVQETLARYLNHLLDLGVAGFRVDAAGHIPKADIKALFARVRGDRFVFLEVISKSNDEPVNCGQYYSLEEVQKPSGHTSEFQYALDLKHHILGEDKLQELIQLGEDWGRIPSKHAVVFVDNHDTQRNPNLFYEEPLSYKHGLLYVLANVVMLALPYGYPAVMSSYFFNEFADGPPGPVYAKDKSVPDCGVGKGRVCEHRWEPVANMVGWRRSAGDSPIMNVTKGEGRDVGRLAFCRGSGVAVACVALNRQKETWEVKLPFPLEQGNYCDIFQSDDTFDCPIVDVKHDGIAILKVPPRGAVAAHNGKRRQLYEKVVSEGRQPSETVPGIPATALEAGLD